MKKLLTMAALSLLSANAFAVDYVLTEVISSNPFAPAGSDLCINSAAAGAACAGTATASGGTVTVTGLAYAFDSANADFLYTGGNWSVPDTGSGLTLTKNAESCGPVSGGTGSTCASLLGDWVSGTGSWILNPDGSVAETVGTSDVTVVVTASTISIKRSSPFPINGLNQANEYLFTVVPVPAAVWLFGSALGLLGWVRRRAAA